MSDATAGRREPGPFRAPRIKARKRRPGVRLALVALAALLSAGLLAGLSTPLGRGSASDGPPYLPSLLGSTDTDGDGCSDAQELGPNQTMGGRRDPTSFWDFFDTPAAAGLRDRAVTVADIFRVAARIGTSGGATSVADALAPVPTTGYHAAFDRTPAAPGTDPWDLRAADGSVSVGDIAASVIQFGHTCAQIGPT